MSVHVQTMQSIPAIVEKLAAANAKPVASEETHYKDWPNECGFNAQVEQLKPLELPVVGNFPPYAAGTLLRVGPGSYKWPTSDGKGLVKLDHWFDGFSHVHKFSITPRASGETSVVYNSRRQADKLLLEAQRTGRYTGMSFGQKRDPCDSFFKKVKSVWSPILPERGDSLGLADIGVAFMPSVDRSSSGDSPSKAQVMVTSDKKSAKEFDMETLEPLGITSQVALHPDLKGPLSSAHPQVDPDTGDVFNYNLDFGAKAVYRVFRTVPSTGETEVLATISGKDIKPSYIHSLFLTRNFVVLCIWPCHFSAGGASVLWNRNLMDSLATWDPKARTIWCVVDRRGGRGLVKKFTSDAMFCFHTTNAWETPAVTATSGGGEEVDITCELVQYSSNFILKRFYYDNLTSLSKNAAQWNDGARPELRPEAVRYRLASVPLAGASSPASKKPTSAKDAGTAQLVMTLPSPAVGDLQTINPKYRTKLHRYVYSVVNRNLSSWHDTLCKTDVETGEHRWWCVTKQSPSEAIFVPRPGAADEDDGVLLSVVLDGARETSYLLCLDARDLSEVARAEVGAAVGLGFHGVHLAA